MTSQPDSAPTRVGDYTLLTQLGEGGMGIVHLARGADGRRVALKVLRHQIVGDREARERLAREVASLGRVRSPWIAEILGADPWGEVPYVVTRYVPGLSLHDHVKEEGPVGDRDLYWLAGCLAEGIDAVHAAGVLHRDVKPSNVLMEGRTPILIDFGLARVADDPRLTRTGWLLGTPGYLAPEILYGDEATPAADVHAWAATVAYAATGRSPYGGGPAMAVLDRCRRGEHDLSGIDTPFADVLDAALSPDPLERPLLEELLAWLRPLSTRPGDPPMPAPTGGVLGADGVDGVEVDDFTLPLALATQPPPLAAVPQTKVIETEVAPLAPAPPAPLVPLPTVAAPPVAVPPPAPSAEPGYAAAVTRLEQEWDEQYAPPPMFETPAPVSAADRIRRATAVIAGALAIGAGFAAAPWVVLGLAVVLVWLLRAGSLAASAVVDRRMVRGHKWYDGLRWMSTSPWHLVRAVTGTMVLTVWSAGLGLAAGLLCYAFALDVPTALAISGTTFGIALWSGPGGSRFRSPVGRVLYPLTRSTLPWLLTTALLLLLAGGLGRLVAGDGVDWMPWTSGPFGL